MFLEQLLFHPNFFLCRALQYATEEKLKHAYLLGAVVCGFHR